MSEIERIILTFIALIAVFLIYSDKTYTLTPKP